MKKVIKRAIAVLIIILLSIGLGFAASHIWEMSEKKAYPVKYTEFINSASEKFGVPRRIIYAVIHTESNFDNDAESSAGAIGLMQITESTFEEISGKLGENYEKGMMYDPATNIRYGTYYLSYLYKYFGDWDTVFAAYNAGMGNVSEWLAKPEYVNGDGKLVNIPYEETRNYVKRVNEAQKKYTELYGEIL